MTVPTPTPEDIRASYGFVAMLAQTVPEVGALMEQAVREKWTTDRFNMAVANTGWWKNTPAPERQWIAQKVADPSTADNELRAGGEQIIQIAKQLGLPLDYDQWERAQQLWLDARLKGYDAALTRGFIYNELVDQQKDLYGGGLFGQVMGQMRQLAAQYGYSPTDQEMIREAQPMFTGVGEVGNMAGWENKMKKFAAGKYSAFADRINAGETVMDIARPYVDVYAKVLEVNPQDVGLDDKYLQQWLQGRSEAGKPPAAVPVWQAAQELRKDARWGYTNNAREAAASVATTIGKAFGFIG